MLQTQNNQTFKNAEIQVMSDAELEQIEKQLKQSQITETKESIPTPYVEVRVNHDNIHNEHTSGLIKLASVALVAILIYAIYETRSVVKIGKIIQKEIKNKT